MSNRLERTRRFEASSDRGGTFTIFEFTIIDECRSSSGYSEVPGFKELRTAEGHAVNRQEKGIYQIVELDCLVVRSTDPNAP
jgi:hypothetical protein